MPDTQQITPQRGRLASVLVITLDLIAAVSYIIFSLRNGPGHFVWDEVSYALVPFFAVIIIYRQPRNPVGWVMAAFGLLNIGSNALGEYAYYSLFTHPGSLPFSDLAAWVASVWWLTGQPVAVAVILLFPNGRPPTRRWWWLIIGIYAISLPIFVILGHMLWQIRGPRLMANDMNPAFSPGDWHLYAFLAFNVWEPSFVGSMALAVIGQGVRFARSRGVERQQLKWVLLAFSVVPFNIALSMLSVDKISPLLAVVAEIFNMLAVLGFPIAMVFAITRYHLYDIDFIIRRTLLYGALTVFLGLLYFGNVIWMQALLEKINGGQSQSPVSIIVSTLLIYVLFSPLRARFQRVIDRRFYRQKYNSQQILETFSASLRSEVDLDAIHQHLLDAVDTSLRPNYAALWLVGKEKRG